ncbi:enoyl-CoA hydratase/isomerase family protein [Bradyrhizobium sp. UFLA01-814]|uniref:enoyl-CoA hydratase/isomerase family protein n=1 Tax=Bradyrhizobium sp. UFLA01-814 TaxID=3023480 RepID=UPI00398B8E86
MSNWVLERRGSLAILTFARLPRNIMDLASASELARLLRQIEHQADEIKVVLLLGGVDGFFIAHADIHDLARVGRGELQADALNGFYDVIDLLEEIPQPVIAAIDGQAWGGGSEIALACSLRIASQRANIGQPEVRIGLIPGARATRRLQEVIGPAAAQDAILRARTFVADDALRLGWVSEVLPVQGFRAAAIAWAETVAKLPSEGLFAAKTTLRAGLLLDHNGHARLERKLFLELLTKSDVFKKRAAQEPI